MTLKPLKLGFGLKSERLCRECKQFREITRPSLFNYYRIATNYRMSLKNSLTM